MRRRSIGIVAIVTLVTMVFFVALLMYRNQNAAPEEVPRGTSREFRFSDVQNHATATDCWVSFGAQVYDISRFVVNLSPDQEGELANSCGTNLEVLPPAIKTAEKLSQYQIGILVP